MNRMSPTQTQLKKQHHNTTVRLTLVSCKCNDLFIAGAGPYDFHNSVEILLSGERRVFLSGVNSKENTVLYTHTHTVIVVQPYLQSLQQWIIGYNNQNSARFNLSSRTFCMFPNKCTSVFVNGDWGKGVFKNTHVPEDKDTCSRKVMVILLQLFLIHCAEM